MPPKSIWKLENVWMSFALDDKTKVFILKKKEQV